MVSSQKKTAVSVSKATLPTSSSIQTPSSSKDNGTASSTINNPSVKRRQGLKAKASAKKNSNNNNINNSASGSSDKSKTGYVLGGADYVDMMMGSRRRAREEAAKMPVD